jgi:hypothetical protein
VLLPQRLVEICLLIEGAQRCLQVRVVRCRRQALDVKRQIGSRALEGLRMHVAEQRRCAGLRHIAAPRLLGRVEL